MKQQTVDPWERAERDAELRAAIANKTPDEAVRIIGERTGCKPGKAIMKFRSLSPSGYCQWRAAKPVVKPAGNSRMQRFRFVNV